MEQKKMETPTRTLIDLPEIAVDEILCRLPIKDVVRTSILSRSWRHRWKYTPDINNMSAVPDAVVSSVILLHSSPIRLFRAQTADSPAVYDWIAALSRRSSASLRTLDISSNFYIQFRSIARFFPQLDNLKLCKSDLGTVAAAGFASLKTLHLHGCRIFGLVSVLLSACPALETLILMYVRLEGPQRVDISSQNLLGVEIVDLSGVLDFSITSAPVLQTAVVDCWVMGDGNLMKVFGGMANIEKLKLGASTLKFLRRGNITQMLSFCFDHLRFMSLSVHFGDVEELLVALCLLRSAPNLQELELKGCFYDKEAHGAGQGFWKGQESACLFDKLEILRMTGIECIAAEVEFIGFVLAKARVLKTTMISFDQNVSNKELLITKLLELPVVSNEAQIIFKCKIFIDVLF